MNGHYLYLFNFDNFFNLANQLGLFTTLLPFLLIFAIVYSILLRIDVFKKVPPANVIISLVISFFALTNYYISYFMQRLFSNLAIALVVFLAVIILFGLFNIDISSKGEKKIFIGLATLGSIIVVAKAFSPHWESYLLPYLQLIFPLLIIIIAIVAIVVSTKKEEEEEEKKKKIIKKEKDNFFIFSLVLY